MLRSAVSPSGVCSVVAEHAAADGAAPAVLAGDVTLSYRELDRRARSVASALGELGVRPGDRVGVHLDRTIQLLPAVLGIWSLGATYVPLDVGLPPRRVRAMLDLSHARAVVAGEPGPPELAGWAGPCVPVARLICASEPAEVAVPQADPGPAYVMFTSGSTGSPKGVVVGHRALAATLSAMLAEVGLGAGDRMLALTSISFDISLVEMLLPLMAGATVVLAPRETARFGDELLELALRTGVTYVQATPAMWRMLVFADTDRQLNVNALCGGDVLPADLATDLVQRSRRVWNLYGPTEATIWASADRVDLHPIRPVTIGTPLRSAHFLVVDESGAAVPPGDRGELLIGGACVADGYLGDEAMTTAKFVRRPGAGRWYRTGDQVRLRRDGRYEFLGRSDTQVKIRGFRVDLCEIEVALRSLPAVRDAGVAAEHDGADARRLVAYLILDNLDNVDNPAAPGDIDAHLRRHLPDYMVPSAYFRVDELPFTANAKLDRARLAESPGRRTLVPR